LGHEKLTTLGPHNSIFQSAEIIYDDVSSIDPFLRGKWGVFIMGEAVRIYPANLTKEEHEAQHQYTAVLQNIPRNAQNTDYMRMFSNLNVAAIGIPGLSITLLNLGSTSISDQRKPCKWH
jgi:hypothetical protein